MRLAQLVMGRGRADGDPYWAHVVSLLHFNGTNGGTTFTDQTGKTWSRGGNTVTSTGQVKFGTAAGYFDGSVDYIATPSHADFNFGSGPFTVEGWFYCDSVSKDENQGLICRDQIGGTRGWLLYTNAITDSPAKALAFTAWVGATPYFVVDTVAMTVGSYVHIAAVRDQSSGDVLRLYKNGVQVASNASISGSVGAPTEPCVIGNLWGVGAYISATTAYNGFADDVRITKGVCRYPGGTTFTPPSAPFPSS